MMGRRKREQGLFFYAFDLDKMAPPDHLVRQIDGTRSATSVDPLKSQLHPVR
jgi:hypothetical protein